jgi:RES domain-containing protein
LAALELLVNGIQPYEIGQFVSIAVDFSKEIVQILDLKVLPPYWSESPISDETKTIGDTWLEAKTSAVLQVPSAVIPDEFNFLINPLHPNFKELKTGPARPFSFDQRLLKS